MSLSSWLYVFDDTCPDEGLLAFQRLDAATARAPRVAIWIGLLLAAEQAVHVAVVALTSRAPLQYRMRVVPEFSLASGAALLWSLFTALSILLVSATFRSSAAVLAKILHVASEAYFLVLLSSAFGMYSASGIVVVFVVCVVLFGVSLPCDETIGVAATGGLALDSANFLAYATLGLSRPDDPVLWLLIGGFGWHALYLVTFVGVNVWVMGDAARTWFRVAGMAFNIVAIEFVLAAAKRALRLGASGEVDLKEWHESFDDEELRVVWTRDGIRLLGVLAEGETRSASTHEPHRTAYAEGALWRSVFAVLPSGGKVSCTRVGSDASVRTGFLCSLGCRPAAVVRDVSRGPERARVLSWTDVRRVYWLCLVALGVVLGLSD